jgi:transcriptional regulator with XRE-family HTH domain
MARTQITPSFYFHLRKVEVDMHSWAVENERTENFAQLIARLMTEYDVNESDIARAIGVSISTVYTWSSGKRGGKRGPRRLSLQALHEAYPKFTEEEIFAAAGRQAPGPMDPDAEQRVMELYRGLTKEQRELQEIQMRAVYEKNQSAG